MSDIVGPLRPCDSWSTTEVRSVQHTHLWVIKGFSQCECRYLETSVKIPNVPSSVIAGEGANASQLIFRLRLHPQGNKESNKDFCFFQVFPSLNVAKFKAKFAVYNTRNEEIPATVYTGTQQLNGYFEYIRRDLLISHIQPQDEIQLVLNLTIASETVTTNSQAPPKQEKPAPRPLELAEDFERIFKDERHSDFKIICRNEKETREIPVHKIVLSARSPVFKAMLEDHTEEAKNSQVVYEDIDYDVMLEMLHFMYSGKSTQIQHMALDLLAAADRFQLIGLKEMADQVLRQGLAVDTVCRNLVFADMHNATDLKSDAIKYIATCATEVTQTEGWKLLAKQNPDLVTEVVQEMAGKRHSSSSFSNAIEPSPKRGRFD